MPTVFVEQPLVKPVVLVNTNNPIVGSLGLINTGENIYHNIKKQLKVSAIQLFYRRTQHTQIQTKRGTQEVHFQSYRVPCPHHKLNVTRQTVDKFNRFGKSNLVIAILNHAFLSLLLLFLFIKFINKLHF